jgi:hypothetical protein
MELVNVAWNTPKTHVEPCKILFRKLGHTRKSLAKWSRQLFSNTKVMMHVALFVLLHFDMAYEDRRLNNNELDLWARLKRKVIALSVVERVRTKQCA